MKKSAKYEVNALLSIVIVAAIVIVIMMICYQHPVKWDLTKTRENTLSEQSSEMMKKLPIKMTATVFTDDKGQKKRAENLLRLYKECGKNFDYRFIEPNKNPSKTEEYGVTTDPSIYFETDGKKREKINEITEEKVTNAMARLLVDKEKTVYFLTGHGELKIGDPENINSIDFFKNALEKEIYTVKSLNLIETGKIPDDASIIVIAGPSSKIFEKEIELLENYMKKGGKTLWLTGSGFPNENRKIFDKYGFTMLKGNIVDKTASMLGADSSITVILTAASSEITKGFISLKSMYIMPMCSAFKYKKTIEGITVIPVLSTSAGCKLSEKDPEDDIPEGIYAAGLTIERPVSGSEETEKVVVLGSSLMAGRQGIKQGENLNILLNSMAWLSEEKNLIAIRPKDTVMEPLSMTPVETSQFFFKTVIAIPFMIVALWLSFKIAKRITRGKK